MVPRSQAEEARPVERRRVLTGQREGWKGYHAAQGAGLAWSPVAPPLRVSRPTLALPKASRILTLSFPQAEPASRCPESRVHGCCEVQHGASVGVDGSCQAPA